MANVATTVLQVSTSLNDQEPGFAYTRWPITELLEYLNEALRELAIYRPDLYTVTLRSQTLFTGQKQQALSLFIPPGDLGKPVFLKSIDVNDTNGTCSGAPITQCDLQLMRSFYKKQCLPTGGVGDYRVISYAYDAKNPQVFYVSPTPPAGGSYRVIGTVVAAPTEYSYSGGQYSPNGPNGDFWSLFDPRYVDLIKLWMLGRALEVDTESSTSQAESSGYFKKFYNALGVDYKQTSMFSSGTYIGQGGSNQMSKARAQ